MPRDLDRNSVLVDTSAWIDFFNSDSESSRLVARLVEENRAVIIGPVIYEVLQGARSREESDVVLSALLGLDSVETTMHLWIKAGELSSGLRKKGVTLPMSDVLIASAAIENDFSVLTSDSHFAKIPHLKLYK